MAETPTAAHTPLPRTEEGVQCSNCGLYVIEDPPGVWVEPDPDPWVTDPARCPVPRPGDVSFRVDVTPRFRGIEPLWDVSVYKSVKAGVCGPAEGFTVDASYAALDQALAKFQYKRTTGFGPVCANGFASAQLTRTT